MSKCLQLRMPVENQEEKTLEVLGVPEGIDEELLSFYFENKRRSGGGPLLSVEKHNDRVLVVFEEAEVAARVLSKGPHVLRNAELTVRKPASKDQRRLLLCGISPGTGTKLIELYVENMMDMDEDDYTLYPSPGRDLILIHLRQPLSKDFQNLRAQISKSPLCGSKITLEQVEQTDSILVENLHPGITTDLLTLYFESKRGGNQEVKEVIMISESTARVSFADFNSVDHVLNLSHKLEDAELVVRPYFAFLQPAETIASQTSENGSTDDGTDRTPQNLTDSQMQSSSPAAVSANKSSHQTALEPVAAPAAVERVAEVVMEDLTVDKEPLSSHIAIPDPVKLALLQISTLARDIQQAHPDFTIQIKDDGVHIAGPDKLAMEQLKNTILEFLGSLAQAHLTFDQEKAQFLANREVKDRLLQTMNEQGVPTIYTVSDSVVVLTSLSLNSVSQACTLLKSQMCDFSIPVDKEYECMLYSQEWSAFLQSLGFCSARISDRGENIEVLTLKGMENEMQAKILKFLTTPIEMETVISMVPGMLKYIQIHSRQLLADMDQVSIIPIEAEDVCGLRIHGRASACQMADELLREVVNFLCTRTITVNRPGVARFLIEEEGTSILGEMQAKFQVYISLEKVHWVPLENEDIFEAAWKMMSHQSFQRVLLDGSVQDLTPVLHQTDQNFSHTESPDRGLIEEAKRIVSAIDEKVKTDQSSLNQPIDMEEDLCTAGETAPISQLEQGTDMVFEDAPRALVEGDVAGGPLLSSDGALGPAPCNLEEEAWLSLAIQYSMESTKRSLADEEEELQKVLELSKKMVRNEGPSVPTEQRSQSEKAVHMSLQDAIKAANTAEIFVCAGYNCDLIRVDIALAKKVTLRQVEEKVEHKSLKNLSELHKRCVELIKRKHAVEIQIQGTTATISGFKDFVNGALPDVKLLLKNISNTTSDAEILRSVEWVWHDPVSSEMTPYAPVTTVFIENAWKMRQKKIDILLNNQPHIINFEKMQEFNVASGKSVKISRKLLSSGDLATDVADEDYSLLSGLPEASRVDEDSDEFQDVVKDFYDSIEKYHNKIRIIKVEKLTNRLLLSQYKLKKVSISQSATDPEVERTLYHGTSESCVKEISIHGFNRSFCGKNATVYGQGVYFAVKSSLSVQDTYSPPNADGHKFVFVTKVLTGDFTKGCHSMKTAPLKESSDIPLRYDSVADNITDPSLFVIFNDTQAYPEYLITCQKIHR